MYRYLRDTACKSSLLQIVYEDLLLRCGEIVYLVCVKILGAFMQGIYEFKVSREYQSECTNSVMFCGYSITCFR